MKNRLAALKNYPDIFKNRSGYRYSFTYKTNIHPNKNLISVWTPENKSGGESALQNAGNYIGVLERLFVFCFIPAGHFEAIGFLLGLKSIFRLGDLMQAKERKLTEYILTGTLLDFGIAILTGLLVQFLLLKML